MGEAKRRKIQGFTKIHKHVMAAELTHIKIRGTVHLWHIVNNKAKSLTNDHNLQMIEKLSGFDLAKFIRMVAENMGYLNGNRVNFPDGFMFVDHHTKTANYIVSNGWSSHVEEALRVRGYLVTEVQNVDSKQSAIVDELVDVFTDNFKEIKYRKTILKTWELANSIYQNPILVCCQRHKQKSNIDIMPSDSTILELFQVEEETRNVFNKAVNSNLIPVFFISIDPEALLTGKAKELPEDFVYQVQAFGYK